MKVLILIALVIAGALFGGIYGAIYDQLTFAISPEFFTKYRFVQNEFIDASKPRLGASIIGFLKTWKAGFVIALVLSCVGLINKNTRNMAVFTAWAFVITLGTAFLAGLIGWSVGPLPMQLAPDPSIKDTVAFETVVNMNNFSYVGAVIGMFVGIFYQVYKHKQTRIYDIDSKEDNI